MSALAHRNQLPAFEIRARGGAADTRLTTRYLTLRATGDGWALLAPEGHVVFSAFGLAARRGCLEFARDAGVLAVLS